MVALTRVEQEASGRDFGWGEPQATLAEKMLGEKRFADTMGFVDIDDKVRDATALPLFETIRKSMPYDDGWDFDYVDKQLYGTAAVVNQNPVGSCVGAGAGSAAASRIAQEILIEGDLESPFGLSARADGVNSNLPTCGIPFIGYHYGCGKTKSRWNGERFTGRGSCSDGSYCSVQIWALQTTGLLPCSKVKNFNKGPQSDDVRSWGCNQRDELNEHLAIGLLYRMQDSMRARNADDLKKIITQVKQPLMICSGWAFKAAKQVDGFGWLYTRNRGDSWSHNMSLVACVMYKGIWYVKVRNQWGPNAHKDGWYFWITLDEANSWLANAEAQSIGELKLDKAKTL